MLPPTYTSVSPDCSPMPSASVTSCRVEPIEQSLRGLDRIVGQGDCIDRVTLGSGNRIDREAGVPVYLVGAGNAAAGAGFTEAQRLTERRQRVFGRRSGRQRGGAVAETVGFGVTAAARGDQRQAETENERQQKHVFQMFHIGILSEIRIGISWKMLERAGGASSGESFPDFAFYGLIARAFLPRTAPRAHARQRRTRSRCGGRGGRPRGRCPCAGTARTRPTASRHRIR